MELQKPILYSLAGDDTALNLHVAVCQDCAWVNFPPDVYGCERCGAPSERLSVDAVHGTGVLRRFVTLHKALLPGLHPPTVIGEVTLDNGLVVEVRIDCDDERELYPGMPVRALGRIEEHDGVRQRACHFAGQEVTP